MQAGSTRRFRGVLHKVAYLKDLACVVSDTVVAKKLCEDAPAHTHSRFCHLLSIGFSAFPHLRGVLTQLTHKLGAQARSSAQTLEYGPVRIWLHDTLYVSTLLMA